MKKNILLVIALMLFATFGAFAQVPADFSIQGYAEDASNQPYNGTINVVFEIYDVATGGTSIYSQTEALTATAGYFEFRTDGVIGSQITAQAKNQLWYQFTIENVAQARVPFAAVPYSITSKWSESAFLADSATPSGNAGGHLEGTYPNPTLNENAVGTLIENYVDSKGIQAVPKGPAGGDIGGNYPNELLIKDRAVKSNHIALNAVRGENLADNTVTAVKIADNAVTLNKLDKGPTGLRLPLHLLVWNPLAYDSEGRLGNWEYASIASAVVNGIDAANSYSIPYVMPGATPATNSLGSSFLSFYPAADVDAVGNPAPGSDVVTVNNGGIFHTPTLYVGTSETVGSAYISGDLYVGAPVGAATPATIVLEGNTTVDNIVTNTEAKYATGPVYGTPYTPEVATTPDNYTDTRFASIGLLNYKLGVGVLANIRNNLPEGQIPFYSNAVSGNFNATSPLSVVNPTAPTAISSVVPLRYDATQYTAVANYMPSPVTGPMLATASYVDSKSPSFSTHAAGDIAVFRVAFGAPAMLGGSPLKAVDAYTNILSTGHIAYTGQSATNNFMPATLTDSMLATVAYVKNSGLTNSNIWSSNDPTAARDLTTLTNLFNATNLYPRLTTPTVSTIITGDVLFSPNAANDKGTKGYVHLPYHIVTIGQVPYSNTAALGTYAEGLLNVHTNPESSADGYNVGLQILPGVDGTNSNIDLSTMGSQHVGLLVNFTTSDLTTGVSNGIGAAFMVQNGDTTDGSISPYMSAGLFAVNYDQQNSGNIANPTNGGFFITKNPALAVMGISEFQGAMVARPVSKNDIDLSYANYATEDSKEQYGTIFTYNGTTDYELGHGWHGQIIYIVNTGTSTFNVTFASATIGQVATGQAMNLIFVEDGSASKGKWYPVK